MWMLASAYHPSMIRKFTPRHFAVQCPMDYEAMEPSKNGRFCERCQREVFDLTNKSLREVKLLRKKHGKICGAVRVSFPGPF